ncbi:BRCT domain-containing protein At4g02110 [Typha latifolia]|uniref:BRCT domain-containing protein At4g02110 n=1 Tax=Typha latifolia TaxID=4733 RepID=UPI003C2C1A76
MLRSRGDSTSSTSSSPGKLFAGIRFVLFGFDSVSEAQYRSELVRRGGIDAGKYDSSCTHVVVSGRVYDDPVCIAARNDGKTLVTEMWIDDSVDFGRVVDANRILYRPVRDLNGIPGSESLNICLTGYQRQEREDIMKMVSLMGARFSKPLIANQVTHLICYKFEGEKYELAKKVNIKLVNHRWLEDCLKDWEILPIDFYIKSGWELEILEAEARDSEEETEDVGARGLDRRSSIGTFTTQSGVAVSTGPHFPTENSGIIISSKDNVVANELINAGKMTMGNNQFTTPCKEARSGKALDVYNGKGKVEEFTHLKDNVLAGDDYVRDAANAGELNIRCETNLKKEDNILSTTKLVTTASTLNEKVNRLSYSRKFRSKSISPEEPSPYSNSSLQLKGSVFRFDFDSSPSTEGRRNGESSDIQSLPANGSPENAGATGSALPQKRKVSVSRAGSKSPKSSIVQNLMIKESKNLEQVTALPLEKNVFGLNCISNNMEDTVLHSIGNQRTVSSKSKALNYKRKSLNSRQTVSGAKNTKSFPSVAEADSQKLQNGLEKSRVNNLADSKSMVTGTEVSPADVKVLRNLPLHDEQMEEAELHLGVRKAAEDFGSLAIGNKTADVTTSEVKVPEISSDGLRKSECSTKLDNSDIKMSEIPNTCISVTVPHRSQHDEAASSPCNREIEGKKLSSCSGVDACKRDTSKVMSGARLKKTVAKRSMNGLNKRIVGSSMINNVDVASVKADSVNTTESKSGKVEKLHTDSQHPSATNSEMNGAVEPLCRDAVIEDYSKVVQHPKSAGNENGMTMDWRETSLESEKENNPVHSMVISEQNSDHGVSVVCNNEIQLVQDKKGAGVDNGNKQRSKTGPLSSLEPAWFILSGHRPQRKEFQTIIRQLRGRVCRDSHHWSYQATHFVVPDPVRRTEKFFAAAAAGRWILKTDYLSASSEAGNFLEEETFEWYKNGLTEDGAISLEAPRKWRQLRERTGHGAFYGLRIIIYGECIAPTLDTLKRVVKAGDGTILATSPPYTRFLKAGVDFAIVSPSMPRVDAWVQEFLRHEVPCVVADYLVEYVCKPSYTLERHVLFKTHAWAEKSFANLLNRSEEIIADARVPSQESDDDICCTVCGSRDRGEVMLICGDEGGTTGCGIGTHIDCCDPPLEAVPEGDWFCSSCSKNPFQKTPLKGTKIISSKRR